MQKLRNGTFIIPGTGERSRRQFTLRNSSSLSSQSDDTDGLQSLFSQRTATERLQAASHNVVALWEKFLKWTQTSHGRGVLKCTLAYFLGSMATFLAPISDFLGKPDGKHIVATLTVYFHPARTVGSMLESMLIAIIAVFYAELICLLSMFTSVTVGSQLGSITTAHILVLLIFIGGGLGFLGWVKQKLNNPLVNTGCTLASIAIIAVVTKEEAVHGGGFSTLKIVQVLKMLVMGISITAAVNLLLWRVLAKDLVRKSMAATSIALGDTISAITRGFLTGSEEELLSDNFSKVMAEYNSAYCLMTKNLREEKFERYFLGQEKIYDLDKVVVKSIEALAQAIGGLRSACDTQFVLLREMPSDFAFGPLSPGGTLLSPTRAMGSYFPKGYKDRFGTLAAIRESDENESDGQESTSGGPKDQIPANPPMFRMPSEIFELFISLLGPSMKSLAYTLSETLREHPFGNAPQWEIQVNENFKQSLRDALGLYNNSRKNALQELYNTIELDPSRSDKIQADIEEVAAACGHFSFSLQTVAEEMLSFLDVIEELKEATEGKVRTWECLKLWKYFGRSSKGKDTAMDDPETDSLLPQPVRPLRKSAVPKGIPDEMLKRRDTFSWDAAPDASKILRIVSERILSVLRVLGRDDSKVAKIKELR
jgi:hypothetical protein